MLEGTRVLELRGGVPSAYCGRLLSDLGAEVVLANTNITQRTSWDTGSPYGAGLWRALHRGKRSLEAGARSERSEFLRGFDLLVIEGGPADLVDLDVETLAADGLVVVILSHFGSSGPRSHWRGSDLVDGAYGGGLNLNGEPGRAPLRAPQYMGDHLLGANGAVAALVALSAASTGIGQVIDVAGVDCWATIQTGVNYLEFMYRNTTEQRHGRRFAGRGYPFSILPCLDGLARLVCVQGREWARAIEMMGDPGWASDERYANRVRNQVEHADELDQLVGEWLNVRTGQMILTESIKFGVPWAPVRTLSGVLSDPQLRERNFFRAVGDTVQPAFPAETRGYALCDPAPAPAVDHLAEVELGWLGNVTDAKVGQLGRAAPQGAVTSETPALAGIRVIDFGWAWAGALPGMVLADFGAEVVRVESRRRLDPMRMDKPLVGDTPDFDQGALLHNLNRNKFSVELDLTKPDELETIRQLIAESDLLIENLGSGVLAKFGLGYDDLKDANPRLVYVSMSPAGRAGPYKDIRSYAPVLTALSGIDAMVGYPGEEPLGLHHGLADTNAGIHAALIALAALLERRTSQLGGFIDLSQLEALVSLLDGAVVATQLGVPVDLPNGNRDTEMAPHGVYSTSGDDEWVAIACHDDAAWTRLAATIGDVRLAGSEFSSRDARLANVEVLERIVGEWTASRDRWEIAELLQRHDIAAAPLLKTQDRFADDHLNARETIVPVEHPIVGAELVHGSPWRLSRTPARVVRPAPLLGEHTTAILESWLGR